VSDATGDGDCSLITGERRELSIAKVGKQRYRVQLPAMDYLNLLAPHRHGEVAMVIQRTAGWVLLQTKATYPPGTFRIPTGTIRKGESAEKTMLRELMEEASLTPGRHRKLCRLEYAVEGGRKGFHTVVYLIEEPRGELMPMDLTEAITAWREAPIADLPSVARELRRLEPPRDGWGLYRSAVHQVVADLLLPV